MLAAPTERAEKALAGLPEVRPEGPLLPEEVARRISWSISASAAEAKMS
jgi:hypothetical protein